MNYMKMAIQQKSVKIYLGLVSLVVIALIAMFSGALVNARTAYQPGGTGTTKTPVFNEFYNVPNGVGDEADFVRVKRQAGTNADYVNTLKDDCKVGEAYTVRTYVHNGADPDFNKTGESIARNTVVKMNVDKFNSAQKDFVFTSQISASNAKSMTDNATLKCDDNTIMKLIPKSVQVYSKPTGYNQLPDSAVNGSTKIGSQVVGSGNVLACWDDRVIIVYEVVIEKIPEEKIPAVCDLLKVAVLSNKNVKVNDVVYKANDATVNNISLDFGDGNSKTISANKKELPYTHKYAKSGKYTIVATLNTTFEGKKQAITSNGCKVPVDVEEEAKPIYACEMFNLVIKDRTVTVSFKPVAENGATFKDASIVYSADGDERESVITDKTNAEGKVVDTYTFAEGGDTLRAVATVNFNVPTKDGMKVVSVTDDCKGQAVLGTTTPVCEIPGKEHLPVNSPECAEDETLCAIPGLTTLPADDPRCVITSTGPGANLVGVFAAITAVGAIAHRKLTLSRQ